MIKTRQKIGTILPVLFAEFAMYGGIHHWFNSIFVQTNMAVLGVIAAISFIINISIILYEMS